MGVSQRARELHERACVVDIHVHPSLKTHIFGHKIWKRHISGGAWWPLTMRVDFPKAIEGGVNVLVSSVYIPELDLLGDCRILRFMKRLSTKRIRRLFDGDPMEQTLEVLSRFEKAVDDARIDGRAVAMVAHSKAELQQIRQQGLVAVLHAVEGAHSLSNDVSNVATLFDRGVCLLTLAHFYENAAVGCVAGIPPGFGPPGCFKHYAGTNTGLTAFGEQVVDEMIRLGMIIDVTHCPVEAREQVFNRCDNRTPIVFSHVGTQPLADNPMSPTDTEMKKIADSGGVIGVIFMNYWLGEPKKKGLDRIVRTIDTIVNAAGEDHVAIGSDFDGFTDPPDDVKDIARMPRVTDALLKAGFSESRIEKLWGLNFQRVLADGWGR